MEHVKRMRQHLAWDSSAKRGTEAERTSEPNGYTKTIKNFVNVVENPSFATRIDYLGM
jgi:hypothetical protein